MSWEFEERKEKTRHPVIDFGKDYLRRHFDAMRQAMGNHQDTFRGTPRSRIIEELPDGSYEAYREQVQALANTIQPGRERAGESPSDHEDSLFYSMLHHARSMDTHTLGEFLEGLSSVEETRELAERLGHTLRFEREAGESPPSSVNLTVDNFRGTLNGDAQGDFSIDWDSFQFERPRTIVNLNSHETREYLVGSTEGEIVVNADESDIDILLHDACPEMVGRIITIRRRDDNMANHVVVMCPGRITYPLNPGCRMEFVYGEHGVSMNEPVNAILNSLIDEWRATPLGSDDRQRQYMRIVDHFCQMNPGRRDPLIQTLMEAEDAVTSALGTRLREWIDGSPPPEATGITEPVECAICGQYECEHLGYALPAGYRLPGGEAPPTESDSADGINGSENENDTRAFDVLCTECGRESTVCIVGPVRLHPQCMSCGHYRLTIRTRSVDPSAH